MRARAPGLVRQARRVRAGLRRRRGGHRARRLRGRAPRRRRPGGRLPRGHDPLLARRARRGPAPAHARPLPLAGGRDARGAARARRRRRPRRRRAGRVLPRRLQPRRRPDQARRHRPADRPPGGVHAGRARRAAAATSCAACSSPSTRRWGSTGTRPPRATSAASPWTPRWRRCAPRSRSAWRWSRRRSTAPTLARAEALEPAHDASVPHPDGPEAEPAKVRG